MEYKRRRRRKVRKVSGGGGRALLLILLLFGAVYIVSISAAGSWMSKHVVEPVVAMFTQQKKSGETAPSSDAQPVSLTTSGRINLPAFECFLLQSGAFADEENAIEQARAIASLGGAGYVWEDGGRYRVIVSGYATEKEARDVKNALSAQGLECSVHEVHSAGEYDVAVTAGTDMTVTSLQTVLYAILSAHDDLLDVQTAFDAGNMTTKDAAKAAYEIYTELENCKKESSALPKNISDMLDDICVSVKDLSESENLPSSEFSAKLKNTQVKIACRFTETVNELIDF